MKLLIIISRLLSIPLMSTLFLKHPELMFIPYCHRASFTLAKNSTEMSGSVRFFMFSANMAYCGYIDWEYCQYRLMCLMWGWNRVKIYRQHYLWSGEVWNVIRSSYTRKKALVFTVLCLAAHARKDRGCGSWTTALITQRSTVLLEKLASFS